MLKKTHGLSIRGVSGGREFADGWEHNVLAT
jgi:hypothetical protein